MWFSNKKYSLSHILERTPIGKIQDDNKRISDKDEEKLKIEKAAFPPKRKLKVNQQNGFLPGCRKGNRQSYTEI